MTARSHRPSQKPEATPLSRSIRLLIVFCALLFPVTFWTLLNPANARAAWAEFSRIMPFTATAGESVEPSQISDVALVGLTPQEQAELLLRAAIQDSDSQDSSVQNVDSQVTTHARGWRGRLNATPRLNGLVNAALNSPALEAREAGIEVELSLDNVAEDPASANALMTRIRKDPVARPWGLWMLGALGNRGVEPQRILSFLTEYTLDSNEQTRYWAVEGLSYLGQEQSIAPLLNALRCDSSWSVQERAAGALGRSGMLTKQQRISAVPALIADAGDPSLSARTQMLAFRALHDITGAHVQNTPTAWRKYWAQASDSTQ
ncbi:MAG TPA: HEAT repeat domain-containing protein [Candidatus Acidoferrales bacterium]|nr:HEAT repeat domain-containing protein [Candidatus Acidoferrales bacterium]